MVRGDNRGTLSTLRRVGRDVKPGVDEPEFGDP